MTQKNKLSLGSLEEILGLTGENAAFEKNRSQVLRKISSGSEAQEGDLVFVAQESFLQGLEKSAASVFVVSTALWDKIPAALLQKKICVRVKDAMLAFAKSSAFFSPEKKSDHSIHPSAVIHPTANIGKNVSIGAFVVVGENAIIEDDVILYSHVYIGSNVKVGTASVLFPHVCIYANSKLGKRVRIHANSVIGADGFGYVQERTSTGVKHVKIHHMGAVSIGNDVEIGASTSIDRGTIGDTKIGDGCIIDNQVQIAHNCEIEEGVVICGSTGIAGSAKIGKYSVIAGFVAIGNKTEIGAGTQVSGFSMVFGKVPAGIQWGGIPARPQREHLKSLALIGRLPELFDTMKAFKKKNKGDDV